LVLGGTDTFNFTNLGTVLTNTEYALFTFDRGSDNLAGATCVLSSPAGLAKRALITETP
jgi:hypothetical protein